MVNNMGTGRRRFVAAAAAAATSVIASSEFVSGQNPIEKAKKDAQEKVDEAKTLRPPPIDPNDPASAFRINAKDIAELVVKEVTKELQKRFEDLTSYSKEIELGNLPTGIKKGALVTHSRVNTLTSHIKR
jgi:hypothetical protein